MSQERQLLSVALVYSLSIFIHLFCKTSFLHHTSPQTRSYEPRRLTTLQRRVTTQEITIHPNGQDKVNSTVHSKPQTREKLGWTKTVHWESKLHKHNYRFLISPLNKCLSSENLTLLILIKTRVSGIKERNVIRETYGKEIVKYNVSARIIFLLGQAKEYDSNKQMHIYKESEIHGDILQVDFIDTYYNLTIKLITGFKWASTFCKNSYYVLSTDDDCIVDVVNLAKDLAMSTSSTFRSNLVLAERAIDWVPQRNPGDKWYTPPELFSGKKWLPFPRGYGYIVSREVAHLLYQTSQKIGPPAPWDDVYCGILLHSLAIQMEDIISWFRSNHIHEPVTAPLKAKDHYIIMTKMNAMNIWRAVQSRYQKRWSVNESL